MAQSAIVRRRVHEFVNLTCRFYTFAMYSSASSSSNGAIIFAWRPHPGPKIPEDGWGDFQNCSKNFPCVSGHPERLKP